MTEYHPGLYCQEVWDLGRSIMFFNTWLSETYYEVCCPRLTRRLYTLISNYLISFSSDDTEFDNEEDLFTFYNQNILNKFIHFAYNIIIQMPEKEKVSEHFETILQNLRNLNNYLETSHGQSRDWVRIHYEYQFMVRNQIWSRQELLNNIPNDLHSQDQQQFQHPSQPN